MAASPTKRCLDVLRKEGGHVAIVERWIPQARKRSDLFGVFDLLWLPRSAPFLAGIQATSASNHAARIRKIEESEIVPTWLERQLLIFVYSSKKPAGKRTYRHRFTAVHLKAPWTLTGLDLSPGTIKTLQDLPRTVVDRYAIDGDRDKRIQTKPVETGEKR